MAQEPTLRVLIPDDWPLWRTLRLAALATDADAFGSRLSDWTGEGDREERWRGRLALAGSYNLVAELDGVPVGMASGVPGEDPAVPELISMWVAPSARGRRVGDALVQAILTWARDQVAAALELAVAVDNAHAIGLYRRHGFGRVGEPGEPDDRGRRELRMRCSLVPEAGLTVAEQAPQTVEVVLVNGPPGVGKSTVARLLAGQRPGTVCIHGDQLRAFAPVDARLHLGPGSTYRAAGALARAYLQMGASRVIVDYCFLKDLHVHRLVEALGPEVPVHVLTLWAPLAVVQERERTRAGRERLGEAVEECYREIDAAPCFAVRVQTHGVDPAQIAAELDRRIVAGLARWQTL